MEEITASNKDIIDGLQKLSSGLSLSSDSVAIILAAGHGKRIKSERSKMLHEVWGKPTVVRVAEAAKSGLDSSNQIIVVGIKALAVAGTAGKNEDRSFVFQEKQKGTGDAVKTALDIIPEKYKGHIFIFPGDMGLLSAGAVAKFKRDFVNDICDMMVLTGMFHGNSEDNYYGRIVRVPEKDIDGASSDGDFGKVIEIKEHKDILALNESYDVKYNGSVYSFPKRTLLEIREFNTGIFVFKADKIRKYIHHLDTDNVQGELYLTDLIRIFNQNGLTVKASPTEDNRTVLGFNVKSVLKEMNNYARENVYNRLKDIITIEDKDDFFIADQVVEKILALDKSKAPLDIYIGKGAFIESNVELNKGVTISNHAHLTGNIVLGEGVFVHENIYLSTYSEQTMRIGRNTEIYHGNTLKGNLTIGDNCRIESNVTITGSDEYPTRIGNDVTMKGRTYVFGCIIDDGLWVEHSVLKSKRVEKVLKKDGTIQKIRYVIPVPEGLDSIEDITKTAGKG